MTRERTRKLRGKDKENLEEKEEKSFENNFDKDYRIGFKSPSCLESNQDLYTAVGETDSAQNFPHPTNSRDIHLLSNICIFRYV